MKSLDSDLISNSTNGNLKMRNALVLLYNIFLYYLLSFTSIQTNKSFQAAKAKNKHSKYINKTNEYEYEEVSKKIYKSMQRRKTQTDIQKL